jgi:hypothetical protein
VVRNFLQVSEERIRNHSVWSGASDEELDEMTETLERFVVSKIYRKIFAPTSADLEKDEALKQRIAQLSKWLEPRHLDISLDLKQRRSGRIMGLAVEQLQKWNTFKAPRDKMVCILNACKAVWKLLASKTDGKPAGADDFLPHLIYTVIRANPPNLYSNVEYISRYRHPDKMAQEFGYYFTQLASVVPFLETLNHKSLSLSEEEFNRNMGLSNNGGRPGPPPRSASAMSLLDLQAPEVTANPPLQRAVSVQSVFDHPPPPAATAVANNYNSNSNAAIVQPQPQRPQQPPPQVQNPARPKTPKRNFKFVGRDVQSLTIAEVGELLQEYEQMARALQNK